MNIRILTQEDVIEYRTLRLLALCTDPEAFGTTYEEFEARSLSDVAERLRPKGSPLESFTLGTFDEEGTLIGTITLHRQQYTKVRHQGTITGMYVAPAARGHGISKALLHQAITYALELPGLEQLHLIVVTTNVAARHLYLSFGFEVRGQFSQAMKLGDTYWDEEIMVLYLSGYKLVHLS